MQTILHFQTGSKSESATHTYTYTHTHILSLSHTYIYTRTSHKLSLSHTYTHTHTPTRSKKDWTPQIYEAQTRAEERERERGRRSSDRSVFRGKVRGWGETVLGGRGGGRMCEKLLTWAYFTFPCALPHHYCLWQVKARLGSMNSTSVWFCASEIFFCFDRGCCGLDSFPDETS